MTEMSEIKNWKLLEYIIQKIVVYSRHRGIKLENKKVFMKILSMEGEISLFRDEEMIIT